MDLVLRCRLSEILDTNLTLLFILPPKNLEASHFLENFGKIISNQGKSIKHCGIHQLERES